MGELLPAPDVGQQERREVPAITDLMREIGSIMSLKHTNVDIAKNVPQMPPDHLSYKAHVMEVVQTPTYGDVAVITSFDVDSMKDSRTAVTAAVQLSERDQQYNYHGKYNLLCDWDIILV